MQVYDDEKTEKRAPGSHDSLGVPEEHAKAEAADLERQFAAPSAAEPRSKAASPSELEDQEADGDGSSDPQDGSADEQNKLGRGFTGGKMKGNIGSDLLKKGSKKWLLGIGAGAVTGMALLLFIVMLFLASLDIPNFMQNVTQYSFVRYTRQLSRTTLNITNEALAVQASQGRVRTGLEKAFGTSALEKFDSFRPQKVLDNLGTRGGLELHYEPRLGQGEILTSMRLGADEYRMRPVNNLGDALSFKRYLGNAQTEAAFLRAANETMKLGDINVLTRSLAMKTLRQQIGASTAGWILSKFKGKVGEAARIEAIAQEVSATGKARPSTAATAPIQDAENAAGAAEELVGKSADDIKATLSQDGNSERIVAAIDNAAGDSAAQKVLGVANPVYAVAVPLCIIYDGSMVKSGSAIDSQTERAQRQFYDMGAKADQQKTGVLKGDDPATLAAAIDGTNAQLGDLSKSDALRVANGGQLDKAINGSTQTNAMGTYDYTLINLLGVDAGTAAYINEIVSRTCGVLTNLGVAGALAVGNIVLTIVTFGGAEAGGQAAATTARVAATTAIEKTLVPRLIGRLFEKTVEQQGYRYIARTGGQRLIRAIVGPDAKKFLRNQALIAGGTFGLTELAKMVVYNRSAQTVSGLAQNAEFANNVFQGGQIAGNEASRKITYGVPLTERQLALSYQSDMAFLASAERTKSPYQRYFDLTDSNSLFSHMAFGLKSNLGTSMIDTLSRLASTVFNPLRYFGLAGTSLNGTARAAAGNASNGLVNFGWTETEEGLISSDSSYGMLENERILKTGWGGKMATDVESTYGACFTETIGTLLSEEKIKRDNEGNVVDDPNILCSPVNLGPKNSHGFGDLVFRWRLAKRYDAGFKHLEDLAKPPQARTQTAEASTGGSASLPSGTSQELAKQLLASPNIKFANLSFISADQLRAGMQEIADTGSQIGCRGVAISSRLLSTILALSQKYTLTIGVIVNGHNCGSSAHSSGVAIDINGVNGTIINASTFNQQVVRDMYLDAAKLLEAGGGGHLNQAQCFSGGNPAAGTSIKENKAGDPCTHLHMDVQ